MSELYDVTDDIYERFQTYVFFIASYLGLQGWEIHVIKEQAADRENIQSYRACTVTSNEDRLAVMQIVSLLDVEPTDYWLAKIAFHECMEVMFADIYDSMRGTEANKAKLVHTIIRTLESTLFMHWWGNNDPDDPDDPEDDDD